DEKLLAHFVGAVAGVEPASLGPFREKRLRSLGVGEIPAGRRRTAEPQSPFHALAGVLAERIRDAHIMAWHGAAHGNERKHAGIVRGRAPRGGLGAAIAREGIAYHAVHKRPSA